jgi:hypothetical protein
VPHSPGGPDELRRSETLALLAAAATGIQVGAAMVVTRFVIEQDRRSRWRCCVTRSDSLRCCRFAVTGALRGHRIAGRDLLPIALLGSGIGIRSRCQLRLAVHRAARAY